MLGKARDRCSWLRKFARAGWGGDLNQLEAGGQGNGPTEVVQNGQLHRHEGSDSIEREGRMSDRRFRKKRSGGTCLDKLPNVGSCLASRPVDERRLIMNTSFEPKIVSLICSTALQYKNTSLLDH